MATWMGELLNFRLERDLRDLRETTGSVSYREMERSSYGTVELWIGRAMELWSAQNGMS